MYANSDFINNAIAETVDFIKLGILSELVPIGILSELVPKYFTKAVSDSTSVSAEC